MKGRRVPRRACNPPHPSGLEACLNQAQYSSILNLQNSAGILHLVQNASSPGKLGRRIASPSGHPPILHLSHLLVFRISFSI